MDKLLNQLISDEKKINQELYTSGSYWKYKNNKTIYQIKKNTLKNFRGINSGVGTSFADNLVYDVRNEHNLKGRLVSFFYKIPIIGKIYINQLKTTSKHISNFLKYQSITFQKDERVKHLIEKYTFNNTTEFGCVQKFTFKKKEYSCTYLEMANRVDEISKHINFKSIKKYVEIGGGFGANIHFLISNYENIKKIIYIDAVPNLYVGTEYLRTFYKNSIIDYTKTREMKEIKFSNNEELEVFCIPPWQIENLNIEIDHFHNAASFVEMPQNVIENYVKYIRLNKVKTISLVSYDTYDPKTTLNPKILNKFFNNELETYEFPRIINEFGRKNIYLIKK